MAEQRGQGQSLNIVLGLLTVALMVGGAAAWYTFSSTQPISTPTTPNVGQLPNGQLPNTRLERTVEVYWLEYDGQKISLAPTPVTLELPGDSRTQILTASVNRLLQGPANADVTTTIPSGTRLNSLKVDAKGVHIDLSQEFTSGGGSTSMQGRVGQIIYTATTLDPNAGVWLSVNGEPLEVLGGEGLILEQPLTRRYFEQNFSL